jgi:hypothetical protein
MVLVAMAILGNIALNIDPYNLQAAGFGGAPEPFAFTEQLPMPGSIMEVGETSISVTVPEAHQVTTASILLDGRPLEVTFTNLAPRTDTVVAQASGLAQGAHSVRALAVTRSGGLQVTEWAFWAGSKETPTPPPGAGELRLLRRSPAPGALRLADGGEQPIEAEVSWGQLPERAQLTLDGEALETSVIEPESVKDRYIVRATGPMLSPGQHQVRLEIEGSAGHAYVGEWSFVGQVPDESHIYFKETDRFVSRAFFDYWQANGGLLIFGYPVSEPLREDDPGTGQTYEAQYFERARFELHRDGDQGARVILGRLGVMLREPDPPAARLPGARYFPETGHNLSGAFLDFWNKQGGVAVFGYPTSEELTETSALDGKDYTVQYFERNRLELHPEMAGTEFEVQLGQLGAELYERLYGQR